MNEIPEKVLSSLIYDAENCFIEILQGGLINRSYKVLSDRQPVLLQKINRKVFFSPNDVQQNYLSIWQYSEFETPGLHFPAPLYFNNGDTLYIDDEGESWRAFEFIKDAYSPHVATSTEQVYEAAQAFGRFTAKFENFDLQQLRIVIPHFHDLSFRFQQFEKTASKQSSRLNKVEWLVDELMQRERFKHFYEFMIRADEFRLRVTHHDAKIKNILFDKSDKPLCLVDLDTVMPGYFYSDLGDLIRTMSGTRDENSTDFEHIAINGERYQSILTGYLKEMQDLLTPVEVKHLHYAGIIMIYMQALRFLTDYLNNDAYYHINYEEENANRAINQFRLLNGLEKFLKNVHGISA